MDVIMREWNRLSENDGAKVWSISPGFLATAHGGNFDFVKMQAGSSGVAWPFIRSLLQDRRDEDVGKIFTGSARRFDKQHESALIFATPSGDLLNLKVTLTLEPTPAYCDHHAWEASLYEIHQAQVFGAASILFKQRPKISRPEKTTLCSHLPEVDTLTKHKKLLTSEWLICAHIGLTQSCRSKVRRRSHQGSPKR